MRLIFLFLAMLLTPSVIAQDAVEQARSRLKDLLPSETIPEAPEPSIEPVQPAPASPKASITFSKLTSSPTVTRYLAVGDYCPACPAGKKRFIASGGLEANIVDWRVANDKFGQSIKVIPSEFTVSGSTTETIVADVQGVDPGPAAILTILAAHLTEQARDSQTKTSTPFISPDRPLYGGWFEYDINVPDSVPSILQKLMKDKQYKNDTLGILLIWPGNQTIKLSTTSVTIEPAIKASVRKFGITASASVSEIRFTPDYKTVTVVTPEVLVPDLTINFK